MVTSATCASYAACAARNRLIRSIASVVGSFLLAAVASTDIRWHSDHPLASEQSVYQSTHGIAKRIQRSTLKQLRLIVLHDRRS